MSKNKRSRVLKIISKRSETVQMNVLKKTSCPLFHPKPSALNAESSLAVMFIARSATHAGRGAADMTSINIYRAM